MKGAEDRRRFAVEFANLELDQLRPGDWLNLRDDHLVFLGCADDTDYGWAGEVRAPQLKDNIASMGGIIANPQKGHYPHGMSVDAYKSLQSVVRNILETACHVDDPINGSAELGEIRFRGRIVTYFNKAPYLDVFGNAHELTLQVLADLLRGFPKTPIKRCSECKKLFVAIGKMIYDSRECSHRATVRKWQRSETGKAYERKGSRRSACQGTQRPEPRGICRSASAHHGRTVNNVASGLRQAQGETNDARFL
jgi:hypothetical protein